MVFGKKISKFGKCKNLSAIMNEPNRISIYYFNNGIAKKEIIINNNKITLKNIKVELPYNEVVPIQENLLVSRLDKSLGIIEYE